MLAATRPPAIPTELHTQILSCADESAIVHHLISPIASAIGATSGVFLKFLRGPDARCRVSRYAYAGDRPASVGDYVEHGFYEQDPLIRPALTWLMAPCGKESEFMCELTRDQRRTRERYVVDFLKPHDIGHIVGVSVPIATPFEAKLLSVGFHKSREDRPFSAEERALFCALTPALRTVLANIAYQESAMLSGELLDEVSHVGEELGFVVLDSDLMVRYANQAGASALGLEPEGVEHSLALGLVREFILRGGQQHGRARLDVPAPGRNDALHALTVAVRETRSASGEQQYLLLIERTAENDRFDRACRAFTFTERETEVARLLASGKRNAEVGAVLGISLRTVENHLRAMYAKARVGSRTQLLSQLMRLA